MKQIHLLKKARQQHLVLHDPSLSFRAKGVLAYLLGQPAEQIHTEKTIRAAASEGRAAVQTALQELEERGYIRSQDIVRTPRPDKNHPKPLVMQGLFDELADHEQSEGSGESAAEEDPSRAAIEHIIHRLNELRATHWSWSRYTPLSAKHAKNVEHIGGRLREGYLKEDLILVLEYLAAVDGGKEESRKYYDCVTPFNTKNFERNLAMAREWDARGRLQTGSMQASYGHDPEIYERRLKKGTS